MAIGLKLVGLVIFPHCLIVYIRSASGAKHACDGLNLNPFFSEFIWRHCGQQCQQQFLFHWLHLALEQHLQLLCLAAWRDFIPKIGPIFCPQAVSLISRVLVTHIPQFKKGSLVKIKISLTETVSNASTPSYNHSNHFEPVHRKALYFPKKNWFGLC